MRRMTNEEAIEVLDSMKVKIEIPKAAETQYKRNVALDMAIEALRSKIKQGLSENDLVSRRKAFEYFVPLWECIGTIMDRDEWEDVCMTTANEIPSAQPELTLEQIEEYCYKRCLSIVDNTFLHKYAQPEQQWIPCNNPSELPKDKKLWVTHDNILGCRYVDELFWDMTEWSDNVSDVVAYMPYVEPEPYKEDTYEQT